ALRLFTLASKAENGLGSSNIAYVYEEGKGVEKNYKKAAEYYSLAVEQGENEALLDLARLYENGGFGLAKNLKKSKEYEAQWNELQTEKN
ncbi:MAG: sel1 repeat family protein, partial [Acinetobacter sp.]|nr:sel1 repeat family protein [Acinetobacter sp.]